MGHLRPDGHADGDLAAPLRHHEGNDPVEADRAQQQREGGGDDQQDHDERPLAPRPPHQRLQRLDVGDGQRRIEPAHGLAHRAGERRRVGGAHHVAHRRRRGLAGDDPGERVVHHRLRVFVQRSLVHVVDHADDAGPRLVVPGRRTAQPDALAERALARPLRARHRPRHDDDRGVPLAVERVEHPPLDEFHAHGVEVAGRHALPHEHRRHLAVGQRPAFDGVPRAGHRPAQGERGRGRGADDAGQRAQAVDRLPMEGQPRLGRFVVARGQGEPEGQDADRVEARIDGGQLLERAHRQARPHEQRQGQGDLDHH